MLTFTGINLTTGQTLRIDTEQRTATVGGVSVLDKITATDWFVLVNGDNDLELTGSGTVSIKVQWRERYL